MSQSLYRKYRSQRFADLVGQQTIVRILTNAIKRGKLSHAYLFCGPRGTGKTSVARIFAKAINCLSPQDGDCCGVCDNCLAITQGTAVDVIEMDAASNRGIDDVRELREKIQRGPLQYKYKTYIIDEVHMISRDGFNALLKTLEEPPAHAIFCLCTTEAEKLPVTIRSRCIRFDFQRLPLEALAKHLQWIAGQEGFALAEDAASELATMAEGSARDAISLLDQLTIYCTDTIAATDLRVLFQLGDPRQVPQLLDNLEAGSASAALASWDGLLKIGTDPQRFLLNVAAELKTRYLSSGDSRQRLALQATWNGLAMLKQDSFPALLVELTLLEIQAVYSRAQSEEWLSPAAAAPKTQPPKPTVPAPRLESSPSTEPAAFPHPGGAVPKTAVAAAAPQAEGLVPSETWEAYLAQVASLRLTAGVHLRNALAGRIEAGELRVVFPDNKASDYFSASKAEHLQALTQAAGKVFNADLAVRLELLGAQSEGHTERPTGQPGAAPAGTPGAGAASVAYPAAEVYDNDEGEETRPRGIDPQRLESADSRMGSQIEAAAGEPEKDSPVTAQQAIDLFEAIELTEE